MLSRIIVMIPIFLIVMITESCGYHLYGSRLKTTIKKIGLRSYDIYGPLTIAIKQELRLNNIMIINLEDNRYHRYNDLPELIILNEKKNKVPVSILYNGKISEYKFTLIIKFKILFPGKEIFPSNIKISRYLLNNSIVGLSKDVEDMVIIQEIRKQAAKEIVYKLLSIIYFK